MGYSAVVGKSTNKIKTLETDTLEDSLNKKDEYLKTIKAYLNDQLDDQGIPVSRIISTRKLAYEKLANDETFKNGIGEYKFTDFSEAEIEERKKTNEYAKEKLIDVSADFSYYRIVAEKYFGPSKRTYATLLAGFVKDFDEFKNTMVSLQIMDGSKEGNKEDATKYVTSVICNGINRMRKTVDDLAEYKTDKEIIDISHDNFGILLAMSEGQTGNINSLANELHITLPQEIQNKITDNVTQMGVSQSGAVLGLISGYLSPYYSEISPQDIIATRNLVENANDSEIFDDNSEFKNGLYDEITSSKPKSPEKQEKYDFTPIELYESGAQINQYIKERQLSAHFEANLATRSYLRDYISNHDGYWPSDKATNNKYNEALEDAKRGITGMAKQRVQDYLEYNIKEYHGINNNDGISLYVDGKKVANKSEAYEQAALGKDVRVVNKYVDTNGIEHNDFVMAFSTSQDDGLYAPKYFMGRTYEKNKINLLDAYKSQKDAIEKINIDDSNNNQEPNIQEKANAFIQESLNKMEEGNRWYISSLGAYGRLRARLQEAQKLDYHDKDAYNAKLNEIKEQANKYLVSRCTKGKRSELADLREKIVYDTLKNIEAMQKDLEVINNPEKLLNEPSIKESSASKLENTKEIEAKTEKLGLDDNQISNDGFRKEQFDLEEDEVKNNLDSIKEEDEIEEDEKVFKKEDQSFNKEVLQGNNPDSKIQEAKKEIKIEDPSNKKD